MPGPAPARTPAKQPPAAPAPAKPRPPRKCTQEKGKATRPGKEKARKNTSVIHLELRISADYQL